MIRHVSLPTLSTDGLIEDPVQIIKRLWIYFDRASFLQSDIYHGRITSWTHIKKNFGHDVDLMEEETLDNLTKYYGAYFDQVNLRNVWTNPTPGMFVMNITGDMHLNGEVYKLSEELKHDKNPFEDDV